VTEQNALVTHIINNDIYLHTHTRFNGHFSGTTEVSRYQKGKTNLDFTEARDSEWQWHQLGHMQVCTLLQTHNHASTPPLSFLQAGCPSCRPTNSVEALEAISLSTLHSKLTTVSDVHQMSPCSLTLEIKVIRKTACLQNVLDSLLLLKF